MSAHLPDSDPRNSGSGRNQIEAILRAHLPGYVPGWAPGELSRAGALMRVFSRYLEVLAEGVNQVPGRSQLAFLDMLGTQLLPAQAAMAPLVFRLLDNAPTDVTLPAGCRVAAAAQPASPSPNPAAPGPAAETLFSTRQTVTLARARLATLYSINPGSDEYADHSAALATGCTLFDGMDQTEHTLFLGHDTLFALGGDNIVVMLSFTLDRPASRELKTQWEYLTDTGWSPLESAAQDDSTGGLRHEGLIMLRREKGPKAKQDTLSGRKSYWLRGRLTTPLFPDGEGGERTVPLVNDIRARVGFKRSQIAPDAAALDGVPLDISKDFLPFGPQPAERATFYLACKEVFPRQGATVEVTVDLSQRGGAGPGLALAWEYFDGAAWSDLRVRSSTGAGAYDFTASPATLSFDCPRNWAETRVNGQKNYWLRARLVGGNYGALPAANVNLVSERPFTGLAADRQTLTVSSNQGYIGGEFVILLQGAVRLTNRVAGRQDADELVLAEPVPAGVTLSNGTIIAPPVVPGSLQPPVVKSIHLAFTYLTDPFELDHCLSSNDFRFEDHTEDCRWPDRNFTPFAPVADLQPAVHLGFDRPLPSGLISLYLDIPPAPGGTPEGSPFVWEYRTAEGWSELGVLDETLGFRRSGLVQFIGQPDAAATPGLGGTLYRVRARLKQGETRQPRPVSGAWLNAIWADQHAAPQLEELGASDGNPGQTFSLQHTPVLEGAKLEVQEWRGRGDGWRATLEGLPANDLRFERAPGTNLVTAVWVTWHAQPHLYFSHPGDRHYTVEGATGLVRLGDVPPAGSRIVVTYSSGGGVAGNVPAGAVKELRTAIPYIQAVTNPIPASGGAEVESAAAVRARGAQRLRHHDQAVSAEDCEWLARQATPEVARVRCLPITGPDGMAQRGWITLLVAPASPDPQPWPSAGFRRRVSDYVASRVPATVARRVNLVGPRYIAVRVQAEIVPLIAGEAALVEARVRDNLNRFLHPLSGGRDGQGWAFGQPVYRSQLARVIEETPGVDYAPDIRLAVDDQVFAEFVPIDPYALAAAGKHELKVRVGVQ